MKIARLRQGNRFAILKVLPAPAGDGVTLVFGTFTLTLNQDKSFRLANAIADICETQEPRESGKGK
ncbi:hypothetical protein [Dietzia timorensis]|uniref:Uncharacterized protein n=1 Tax=Dietzia timorensis TaxID=499555 RepID=A0A173LM69_9ACTN|nr:hypothetical protein [Dietzia timorensis]ANI91670.1 Hypothetical protein BJL86_0876 [Dietzia timorensis]